MFQSHHYPKIRSYNFLVDLRHIDPAIVVIGSDVGHNNRNAWQPLAKNRLSSGTPVSLNARPYATEHLWHEANNISGAASLHQIADMFSKALKVCFGPIVSLITTMNGCIQVKYTLYIVLISR